MHVTSLDECESLSFSNVIVVPKIPVQSSIPDVKNYPHFKGLQFVDGGQRVDILIGQDNAEALVPLEVRQGQKGEPFASKSLFGWSVNGPDRLCNIVSKHVLSHFISSSSSNSDVDKLWD